MSTTKRPRKPGELENRFNNQMDYLFRSCRAFDAGHENEAARIAATLRILLHQTKTSHALLAQLNYLSRLSFVDSGVRRDLLRLALNAGQPDDGSFLIESPSETGLVVAGFVNGRGKFVAPLVRNQFHPQDPRHKGIVSPRTFQDWWETPFIETTGGRTFSRKNLILIMANQDGGSHVDPEIDADFSDFCQDHHEVFAGLSNSEINPDELGNFFPNVEPLETNIVHASIRQVAYEVMCTVDDFFGSEWAIKTGHQTERPSIQPIFLPMSIRGFNSDENSQFEQ